MAEIIAFDKAMNATEGKDRTLLLGNGFSAEYFSYQSLLGASGIKDGTPLHNVFKALSTVDFEKVVRALEDAALVEKAYGHDARVADLLHHAQEVREALLNAVSATHPPHREELSFKYESSSRFIAKFNSIFSLNYDLLLYWVNLQSCRLGDGFGLGEKRGSFHGPFKTSARCELYNLHGGLHLFTDDQGEIYKGINLKDGVVWTIIDEIKNRKRLPVYVAEGNSAEKMKKINSVKYLRVCYEKLKNNGGVTFVYGHSANDNDAHIYKAIFESSTQHIYFGLHRPTVESLSEIESQLVKYQKLWGPDKLVTFFDSESASVWS